MNEYLNEVFSSFKNAGIRYVVLRGYCDEEELNRDPDIDIYVHPEDIKQQKRLLKTLGWYSPRINVNKKPHKQYYKFVDGQRLKLDIVNDLYFGKQYKYVLKSEDLFEYSGQYYGRSLCTLNPKDALVIFILHLTYDKGAISKTNQLRLNDMLVEATAEKSDGFFATDIISEIIRIVNHSEETNLIDESLRLCENMRILSNKRVLACTDKICLSLKSKMAALRNLFVRKTISVIGVDGTGKSTVLKNLEILFDGKAVIQYMGFRSYTSIFARRYNNKKTSGLLGNLIETISVYFEMWHRYLSKRYDRKHIVIFDRYVNESYINATGLRKGLTTFLFRICFPKPKKVFYLHCPVEVSLSRKDDIPDSKVFEAMKKKFDKTFMGKKKIHSYNSSEMSSEEIARLIYNEICVDFAEYVI